MESAIDTSLPADAGSEIYDGDKSGLEQAADELARRREVRAAERPEAEPEEDDGDPEVTKLRWQDGRDPDTPITLQEAARDLSTYRKEQKERLLQEVQAQWDQFQGQEQGLTAQPEKTPETEPQQPQESPEEQWAKYVDALPPEGKLQVQAAVEYSQKAQAAEQTADTYAMALTEVVALLQGQTDRAFADIKTVADAQNLQVRDPARFAILRQALQQAVKWQLLWRNPADLVKPPKVERKRMRVLDADDTAGLIEAARSSTLFLPILLGVLCGLRRGEIAALRWRNIDLDTGQISVVASIEQTEAGCREKETKSGRERSVIMPALLADELRRYRLQQAEGLLQLGIRLMGDNHVLAQADGTPFQPRSLTHAFIKFIRKHNLRRIRLHDLRHTHATHMLAAGVHPKIAQERLGHSSIDVTMDLYSHTMPGMQAEAADRVDAALRAALKRRGNAGGDGNW
jgi:integrase